VGEKGRKREGKEGGGGAATPKPPKIPAKQYIYQQSSKNNTFFTITKLLHFTPNIQSSSVLLFEPA
jgi:hypothetical protein